MRLSVLSLILLITAHFGCKGPSADESVLTQHNDNSRTGAYLKEVTLTPDAVRSGIFRRLCSRRVEGQVAAQPLYVKGVRVKSRIGPSLGPGLGPIPIFVQRNVLYVVTRKNYIYAFNADNTDQNDPNNGLVWGPIRLTAMHGTLDAEPIPGMDDNYGDLDLSYGASGCGQTHGPVGITSTPVIDLAHQVMYVVFRVGLPQAHPLYGTSVGTRHFVAAIDITDGQELTRTEITADGFQPQFHLNRPGLLLMQNTLYIGFGSAACDNANSHGWVFAYKAFNENTNKPELSLLDAYNTSPLTSGAGIWQSGAGLAGDDNSHAVYAFTGNDREACSVAQYQTGRSFPGFSTPVPNQVCSMFGPLPVPDSRDDRYHPSRRDLGESILKLTLNGNKFDRDRNHVTEHFTAGNWFRLDTGFSSPFDKPGVFIGDSDLGSGGPLLMPNGFVVGGGKQGVIYVVDPSNMKTATQGFQGFYNTWHRSFADSCSSIQSGAPNDCADNKVPGGSLSGSSCTIRIGDYDVDQAYGPNIHGALVLWNRASFLNGIRPPSDLLYGMAEKDYLRKFEVDNGHVTEHPDATTCGQTPVKLSTGISFPDGSSRGLRTPDGMPGASLSLSANGAKDGILWLSLSPHQDAVYSIQPGVLMAFNAMTLEFLWVDPDDKTWFAKFVPPTVANGKVFRATFGENRFDQKCNQPHNTGKRVIPIPGVKSFEWSEWPSCGSVVFYGLDPRWTSVGDSPPVRSK